MRKAHHTHDEALARRVQRLREMLVCGDDLAAASDYFHEALVADESFMGAGSDHEDARLLAILRGVVRPFAPAGALMRPMIVRARKHGMSHGCAFLERGVLMFFYFDELDLGLCSYQRSLSDPNVRFIRFSVTAADNSWMPGRVRGTA